MIEPLPHAEYTITREQLEEVFENGCLGRTNFLKFVGTLHPHTPAATEQAIRQDAVNKVLDMVNRHIAIAKSDYKKGCKRDSGKWVGGNSTSYPSGKVDALEDLSEELRSGKQEGQP